MKKSTKKLIALGKSQGVSKPFWSTFLFGIKVELDNLPAKLAKGERVYTFLPCKYKRQRSIIVVTSERVLVFNQGYLGILSNNSRVDVYYDQMSGGNPSGRFISSYSIHVPGSGNDIVVTGLWGRDAQILDTFLNKARQNYNKPKLESTGTKIDDSKKERIEKLKSFYRNKSINLDEYTDLLIELIKT